MKRVTTRNPSNVRGNLFGLVLLDMKHLLLAISLALAVLSPSMAGSVQLPAAPKVVALVGTPSLSLKNLRIDSRDGKIRGTAYVRFGYAPPRSVHVHAYGLDSAGTVVAEGCDNLSGVLLAPHPRRAGKGRDAFGIELDGNSSAVRSIRVVSHLGRSDCLKAS